MLAFTGTYGEGPRPETVVSVHSQTFGGRIRHELSWHNPYGAGDLRNVLAQMERARELALAGGYDALWVVEHDMEVPAHALSWLWATGAPVAYGAYLFRHGRPVLNLLQRYPGVSRNLGESLSLHRPELRRARRWRRVPVSGLGFGCTLIRRGALEAVAFRDLERPGCVDMAFAQDCLARGLESIGCLDVLCGHWNGREWLTPFAKEAVG